MGDNRGKGKGGIGNGDDLCGALLFCGTTSSSEIVAARRRTSRCMIIVT